MASSKSKVAAAVLAFFLGTLGIHKFYLGDKKMGAIRLVITVVGYILTMAGGVAAAASVASGGSGGIGALAIIGYLVCMAMGIWAFVDFIMILMGKVTDAEGNPLA